MCTGGPLTLETQLLMTEIHRDLGVGFGGRPALLRVLILHLIPSFKCNSLKFHYVAFRLWVSPTSTPTSAFLVLSHVSYLFFTRVLRNIQGR